MPAEEDLMDEEERRRCLIEGESLLFAPIKSEKKVFGDLRDEISVSKIDKRLQKGVRKMAALGGQATLAFQSLLDRFTSSSLVTCDSIDEGNSTEGGEKIDLNLKESTKFHQLEESYHFGNENESSPSSDLTSTDCEKAPVKNPASENSSLDPSLIIICAEPNCCLVLGMTSSRFHCRCCFGWYCKGHAGHPGLGMRLSLKTGQADPVDGVWSRVCQRCFHLRFYRQFADTSQYVPIKNSFSSFQVVRNNQINDLNPLITQMRSRYLKLLQTITDDPLERKKELRVIPWELDSAADNCRICEIYFYNPMNIVSMKRKHHCRLCGLVICSDCSTFISFPQPLPPNYEDNRFMENTDPAESSSRRICESCKILVVMMMRRDENVEKDLVLERHYLRTINLINQAKEMLAVFDFHISQMKSILDEGYHSDLFKNCPLVSNDGSIKEFQKSTSTTTHQQSSKLVQNASAKENLQNFSRFSEIEIALGATFNESNNENFMTNDLADSKGPSAQGLCKINTKCSINLNNDNVKHYDEKDLNLSYEQNMNSACKNRSEIKQTDVDDNHPVDTAWSRHANDAAAFKETLAIIMRHISSNASQLCEISSNQNEKIRLVTEKVKSYAMAFVRNHVTRLHTLPHLENERKKMLKLHNSNSINHFLPNNHSIEATLISSEKFKPSSGAQKVGERINVPRDRLMVKLECKSDSAEGSKIFDVSSDIGNDDFIDEHSIKYSVESSDKSDTSSNRNLKNDELRLFSEIEDVSLDSETSTNTSDRSNVEYEMSSTELCRKPNLTPELQRPKLSQTNDSPHLDVKTPVLANGDAINLKITVLREQFLQLKNFVTEAAATGDLDRIKALLKSLREIEDELASLQ